MNPIERLQPRLRQSWHDWIRSDLSDPVAPAAMLWIWTLLLAATFAALFTLVGVASSSRGLAAWVDGALWRRLYVQNAVVSLCICALVHLLFEVLRLALRGRADLRQWRRWQRSLFFSGVTLTGVVLGWPLGIRMLGVELGQVFGTTQGLRLLSVALAVSLIVSVMLHLWLAARAEQIDAQARATEARLKLLQGQMEPHFLFNTLAGIAAQIDEDPPQARRTLQTFTDYLRDALAALRSDAAPLTQELDLVRHYLQLMQQRMAERLHFELHIEPGTEALVLPPLLLQPLVENAVLHGLEPTLAGGTVRVGARRQGAWLELTVDDDGQGLTAARHRPSPDRTRGREPAAPEASASARTDAAGHGLALDNLRERLASRYDGRASMRIEDRQPGTRVSLRLPLDGPTTPSAGSSAPGHPRGARP